MENVIYQGGSERIDLFLSKHFSLSRNFFQHILKRGGVTVNNHPIKKSYQLQANDIIEIDNFQRFLDNQAMEEAPKIEIPILYETSDFLVINKPKGVLSHPRTIWELHEPSVSGFLYHKYKSLPSIGNFIRAGILHRLDKQTDGLMIVAKTEKGLAHFKNLFQAKSESQEQQAKENVHLKKFYRATCETTPKGEQFLLSIKNNLPYIIESLVIAKLPHITPKIGITKILNYSIFKDKEKVIMEIEILTGRTHQIRYHLSQVGLPIVGDYLYGKETGEAMQLTAWKLIFEDLDGKLITVEI
ncbi:MAG: RluA family pseudouridine synthase [Candidatus Absconditabacteria bacterium]|nr:RluA family pseudouridine synthase [Candidatus Absconditabacteria bacterium]